VNSELQLITRTLANALISASLTGQISNLEDKLAAMYNEMGTANSGVLYSVVGAGSAIIENYENIGKVLVGLVAVYGTYKTAVLISNAVQMSQIAINELVIASGGLINAKEAASIIIKERLTFATIKQTAAQLGLNVAILANPYVLATMAVVALATAMWVMYDNTTSAERAQKALNDRMAEQTANADAERSAIEKNIQSIKDETTTRTQKQLALNNLQTLYPDIFANLDIEMLKNKELAEILKLVNIELEKKSGKKDTADLAQINDALKTNPAMWNGEDGRKARSILGDKASWYDNNEDLAKKLRAEKEAIITKQSNEKEAKKQAEFDSLSGEKKISYLKAQNAELEKQKKLLASGGELSKIPISTINDKIDKNNVLIKNIQNPAEEVVSKTPAQIAKEEKENAKREKAALQAKKEAASKLAEWQKSENEANQKLADDELALLRSKITNKKDLIDLDYEQTIEAIKKDEDAARKVAEAAGKKFDSTPFDKRRTVAGNKRVSDKQAVDVDDAKVLKEQLDAMLLEYQSFEERRKALNEKYEKERKVLVESKSKSGANIQQIDSAIQTADQYNKEDNQAIDKAIAEKEISFKGFVDRITKMGLDELLTALENANNAMQSSDATDEEKAVLRAKIQSLQEQIKSVKTNGGKDSEADVISNAGLTKSKETLGVLQGVNSEIGSIINSFDGLDEGTKTALNAAQNIAGAVISSIIGVISLSVVGAEAIKGVERASVILAIIGAAISVITIIIGLFASAAKKRKQEEEAAIERQRNEYLGLLEYNNELEKKYEWTKKIGEAELEYIARTGAELKKQSQSNSKEQSDLFAKLQQQTYVSGTEKSGWFNQNTVDVNSSLAGKTYEEISKLAAQGKLSKEGKEYYEALKKAKDEGEDLAKRQEEYLEKVRETFTGTTSQTVADSIIEGFKAGKRSAADFADTFESLMQGAVQSALKQLTDENIRQWYVEFASLSQDGLTPEEQEKLKASWDKLITETATNAANLEATTGVSLTDKGATRQASQKGFAAMSQESADELNGRFTAMQGHTFSISEGMKILQANSAQSLKHLAGIETNTARLQAIEKGIETINLKGVKLQ